MARDGINGANEHSRAGIGFVVDKQIQPSRDGRNRVNASARFYIAVLECGTRGCTLYVNEGAERVRHRENGRTIVRVDNDRVILRPAHNLRPFVAKFLSGGVGVSVGGLSIENVEQITPTPFVWQVTPHLYQRLKTLHPQAV